MIQKELNSIEKVDLENLIENSIKESKTIEYKETLKISSENEKKEFLFDVTSFANASGGDLIFGISENRETGFPDKLVGIESENIDSLQLKIDSLLRDTISPRLTGVQIKVIELEENRNILILRIAKSWNSPHQVTYRGTDKFYTRSNNGKYKLDVFELKNAFLASESLSNNISNFRNQRISEVVADDGFAPLHQNGKIILHLIPLVSFETGKLFEINEIIRKPEFLNPLGENSSLRFAHNFDGILSYTHFELNQPNKSYLQLFKNGIIETVNSWIIQEFNTGQKKLFVNNIEQAIWTFIQDIPNLYKLLKLDSPFVFLLTMTGVKGYTLGSTRYFSFDDMKQIEKDTLVFPELLIEEWNIDTGKILKPWFDAMWNAVGFKESPNYSDGNWKAGK